LGDVPLRDIRSPRNFLVEDHEATEAKRVEAENAVPPVYDFDSNAAHGVVERLHQNWEGLGLSDRSLQKSLGPSYREIALQSLGRTVEEVMERRIVTEIPSTPLGVSPIMTLRYLPTLSGEMVEEESVIDSGELLSLQAARSMAVTRVEGISSGLPFSVRKALKEAIPVQIQPNLTLNRSETEIRKFQARELVKPVLFQVQKGEILVSKGIPISSKEWTKLQVLYSLHGERGYWGSWLATILLVFLLFSVSFVLAQRNVKKFRSGIKDIVFMSALLIGFLLLVKLGISLSDVLPAVFPLIPEESFRYMIPLVAAAAMARLCLNTETAIVFSISLSILASFLFNQQFFFYLYFQIGSIAIVQGVTHCSQRGRLVKAGLQLGLIQVLFLLSYRLIEGESWARILVWQLPFAFAGGLLVGMVITGVLPIFEGLFRYTTDIRLVELATMDHPLLRELILKTPGSYHHSLIVSSLSEEAARAIGANPLICRVGALFHDIGKTRKPRYFVENQMGEENLHDKLSPHMSALIIQSHVKEGIDLAREHRLPEAIVDIIPQHHGTSPIRYFYDKALEQTDPETGPVQEEPFRYPGPKPQTREAGIIMLADSVEASARTLTNPNLVRIQGMVQRTVNRIFTDGQLNECMLTLRDLHEIARCFIRVLAAIYHQRVDYPEPVAKGGIRRKFHVHYNPLLSKGESKSEGDKDQGSPKEGKESLKRLGMS
jgi:putative nucleotidyltransferase with HDIG domain